MPPPPPKKGNGGPGINLQKRVISDADREWTPQIGLEDENEKKRGKFRKHKLDSLRPLFLVVRNKSASKAYQELAQFLYCELTHIHPYICCEVIIWSKFGGFWKLLSGPSWVFGSYYLVQVCVFSL